MATMTEVEHHLSQHNLVALADGGYTASDELYTITDLPQNSGYRRVHAGFRSVIEQCFAHVQQWRAADAQFVQQPELQEMALLVIYSLVQLKHAHSSPRPTSAGPFPADDANN